MHEQALKSKPEQSGKQKKTMNQNQKKLRQAKEDLVILKSYKATTLPYTQEWHRLRRSIQAKEEEIKRLEGKCQKQLN